MEEGSSKFLTSAGFDICNAKLRVTALTTVFLPSKVAFQVQASGFRRSMDHDFAQAFSKRVLLVTDMLNLISTVDQSQGEGKVGKSAIVSFTGS